MGTAARVKAREYSLDKNVWRWERLFASLEPHVLAGESIRRGAMQIQEELGEFYGLVGELDDPPRVVVEIGTALGGVFSGLCRLAADDALLVSIDLPQGEKGADGIDYSKTKETEETLKSYAGPNQVVHTIRGDSHSPESVERLQEILGDKQIDLLFIDGDHSYAGVRADYDLYRKFVAPGGLIAFHDIKPHTERNDCFVDKFWNEVKRGRRYVEIRKPPHNQCGIGVLYAGKPKKQTGRTSSKTPTEVGV
jgi:predicted O-methyltransferase YrrM